MISLRASGGDQKVRWNSSGVYQRWLAFADLGLALISADWLHVYEAILEEADGDRLEADAEQVVS